MTAKLFTANAISMYTNIPTNTAIMLIAKHIHKSVSEERPKLNEQNEALIAALKLVMFNNIFSFGDMTFNQLNGTAMPPPPCYDLLWSPQIKIPTSASKICYILQAFINDVFGIWFPHPIPQTNVCLWNEFTKSMNNYPGLT